MELGNTLYMSVTNFDDQAAFDASVKRLYDAICEIQDKFEASKVRHQLEQEEKEAEAALAAAKAATVVAVAAAAVEDTAALKQMMSEVIGDAVREGVREINTHNDINMERVFTELHEMHELQVKTYHSLEKISLLVIQGDEMAKRSLSLFKQELQQQLAHDQEVHLESLQRSVEQLAPELTSSLQAAMTDISATAGDKRRQNEKLEVLLSMVENLQHKIDSLDKANGILLKLASKIECKMNKMPYTFVIKPEAVRAPLGASASRIQKIGNFAKRFLHWSYSLAWSRSRLVFVCPITMKQVPCGLDGNGYIVDVPTDALKMLAPVLKFGLFFLKVALTTQGLGGIVPEDMNGVSGLLPGGEEDYYNLVVQEIGQDMVESQLEDSLHGASDQQQELDDSHPAVAFVYSLVKKAELGDAAASADWSPRNTGLHLVSPKEGRGLSKWMSDEGEAIFQQRVDEA